MGERNSVAIPFLQQRCAAKVDYCTQWFPERGIFGTRVDMIARIMDEVNPLKELTYLFNLGSFVTGGVGVRYKLLHILHTRP